MKGVMFVVLLGCGILSFLFGGVLLIFVILGIASPEFHGSPQAPLGFIFLGIPSIVFGLPLLVIYKNTTDIMYAKMLRVILFSNCGIILVALIGTVIWLLLPAVELQNSKGKRSYSSTHGITWDPFVNLPDVPPMNAILLIPCPTKQGYGIPEPLRRWSWAARIPASPGAPVAAPSTPVATTRRRIHWAPSPCERRAWRTMRSMAWLR